ncbi:hypothetical protein Aple_073610 [Acrocarpospora pleiomorpha]|uniref:Uncharacterized protein n=1 Tax=Acrocarpospora pleiomorpha TaxID=90975 RepID=A0A5M3XTU2_9ACTN|nr:hypothetical protein [Acrocarpospora pleiomorpha]GES24462.1 hypothetical protein Aple_073610 [Acrocarpospora pleiomorpha]
MTYPTATATIIPASPPPLAFQSTVLAWLILGALAWALFYTVACIVAPFSQCRDCGGIGKTLYGFRRRPRPCRLCACTGLRLRWGRRLWNYLHRLHREGAR